MPPWLVRNMQQRPGRKDRNFYPPRSRRTQPALPGATLATASAPVRPQQYPIERPTSSHRRPNYGRRALLAFIGLGLLLEALLLATYPLLAGATSREDAAKQALLGLLPWLPHLYWTTTLPALVQIVAHIPAFALSNAGAGGNVNLLLLLWALAFVITLVAGRIGSRVLRERLSRTAHSVLFSTILVLTAIFALTCFFAPPILSQDMFLYGIYGHLVTVYHVNPYVVSLTAFPHEPLQRGISGGVQSVVAPGPVWLDLCIPMVLLARDSIANILLLFRGLGLAAHLINTILIWIIVAKLKPEMRISGTILYGWNPLVLLLSINSMHLDVVVVLFILLAILFFQRGSPILGWVLMLLAMLINMLVLILLPLFFCLLLKEARTLTSGRRALWWPSVAGVSVLVLILAYAPYWSGWGLAGLLTSMQHVFLQDNAINSLDAALIKLPVTLPPVFAWLVVPHHWTIFVAIIAGSLLLLGCWLADTVELVVLFSSWVSLALLALMPTYWPWYALVPLALSLCSVGGRTILLAMLLTAGALLSCYFLLLQPPWPAQGLVTIGLPVLAWGWTLFFITTWEMTHAREPVPEPAQGTKLARRGFSRPSWPRRGR